MKKHKPLNKFQEFMLILLDKTFGKLFDKWDEEDANKRKSKKWS